MSLPRGASGSDIIGRIDPRMFMAFLQQMQQMQGMQGMRAQPRGAGVHVGSDDDAGFGDNSKDLGNEGGPRRNPVPGGNPNDPHGSWIGGNRNPIPTGHLQRILFHVFGNDFTDAGRLARAGRLIFNPDALGQFSARPLAAPDPRFPGAENPHWFTLNLARRPEAWAYNRLRTLAGLPGLSPGWIRPR